MPPPHNLPVILNPAAGARRTLRADLCAALDRHDLRYTLHTTAGPGDAHTLADRALEAGASGTRRSPPLGPSWRFIRNGTG